MQGDRHWSRKPERTVCSSVDRSGNQNGRNNLRATGNRYVASLCICACCVLPRSIGGRKRARAFFIVGAFRFHNKGYSETAAACILHSVCVYDETAVTVRAPNVTRQPIRSMENGFFRAVWNECSAGCLCCAVCGAPLRQFWKCGRCGVVFRSLFFCGLQRPRRTYTRPLRRLAREAHRIILFFFFPYLSSYALQVVGAQW